MSFESALHDLAERISEHQEQVETEEAAKQALVLPFIHALGYDVFNPKEVIPEYVADLGIKKGEKVDYAIINEARSPFMFIECKKTTGDMGAVSETQLVRYFNNTSTARFGILTNGIQYKFYSDLERQNIMDDTPFYDADLSSIIDSDVNVLSFFRKGEFDEDSAIQEAEQMKYVVKLRQIINRQFFAPDEDLVKWLTKQVYAGKFTQAVKERFTKLVVDCLNEEISSRVKRVIERSLSETSAESPIENEEMVDGAAIEASVHEIEGLAMIRALTHDMVASPRIVTRDRKSYCSVIVDDNQRKPVARMYFHDPNNLQVRFYDHGNKIWGPHIFLESLDNLHDHAGTIRASISTIMAPDTVE